MGKVKYKFNKDKLSFDAADQGFKRKFLRVLGGALITFLMVIMLNVIYSFKFDTPQEKRLRQENKKLEEQFDQLYGRFQESFLVLEDIKNRDLTIFQTIFESNPINDGLAETGMAKLGRNINLEELEDRIIVDASADKINMLFEELAYLDNMYNHFIKKTSSENNPLDSIPSIQPVRNDNLNSIAAGWGWKIHPIYKIKKFHYGQDFTAPIGAEVFATADGRVKKIKRNVHEKDGKTIVIDHGNGYETEYAHLQDFNVRYNQKVKKGDVIAWVGNTGRSIAPHLHYEVHHNGEPVNPIYYCFGGVTPREFDRIIEVSERSNQTFD